MRSHNVEAKIWTVTSANSDIIRVYLPLESLPLSSLPREGVHEVNSTLKYLDPCAYSSSFAMN